MSLFDQFISRTIIRGRIKTVKPLHIGAGEDGIDPVQVDSPVLKDAKGFPLIPGSSLKGVLRSRLEAVLSNPAFHESWTSCNILDDEDGGDSCNVKIKTVKNESEHTENSKQMAEQIYHKSCDVCKLFGNGYMSAKVHIKDMYFIGDKIVFERRDGVGIDRDTGTSAYKKKYDFQIVPADTEFDFYMIGENLETRQQKLLKVLLTMLQGGEVSVGGMISRGLGQIKLTNVEKTQIDCSNIAQYYGLE